MIHVKQIVYIIHLLQYNFYLPKIMSNVHDTLIKLIGQPIKYCQDEPIYAKCQLAVTIAQTLKKREVKLHTGRAVFAVL